MHITEPFEISVLLLKRPFATFQRFRQDPPALQMLIVLVLAWTGVSSYIYSYLDFERTSEKFYQFIGFSALGATAFLVVFFALATVVFVNSRIMFGLGGFEPLFIASIYIFLSLFVFMAIPVHLMSVTIIPPAMDYWFSVSTRAFIIAYYLFLLIVAVHKINSISMIRSAISVFLIFVYGAFFAFSSLYISKFFNVPLF